MKVAAVVAMSRNRVIGKNNALPWYLSDDLKLFKRLTLERHVIMGRKCFESIGNPLPKRVNIVVTRNPYFIASNVLVAGSLEEALTIALENGEEEAMVIGGGEIYSLSIPYLDTIHLTEVETEIDGDTFFPELNPDEWREEIVKKYSKNENNDFDFTYKILHRVAVSDFAEEE